LDFIHHITAFGILQILLKPGFYTSLNLVI